MAAGQRIQITGATVQSIWCPPPTSPPSSRPCEITFTNGIIATVSGDRMFALLVAAAAAGHAVDVWYIESKPVPYDAPSGTYRIDRVVEATL